MTEEEVNRYNDLYKRVYACKGCIEICNKQKSLNGGHINLRRKNKNRRTIKKNRKYSKKTRVLRV
jgi:hypothetical protein